jgi:hypothetical protein
MSSRRRSVDASASYSAFSFAENSNTDKEKQRMRGHETSGNPRGEAYGSAT